MVAAVVAAASMSGGLLGLAGDGGLVLRRRTQADRRLLRAGGAGFPQAPHQAARRVTPAATSIRRLGSPRNRGHLAASSADQPRAPGPRLRPLAEPGPRRMQR